MPAIHGGIEQKLALKSVQGRTLLSCLNPLSQVKILEASETHTELNAEGLNPLSQVKTIRVAFLFFR